MPWAMDSLGFQPALAAGKPPIPFSVAYPFVAGWQGGCGQHTYGMPWWVASGFPAIMNGWLPISHPSRDGDADGLQSPSVMTFIHGHFADTIFFLCRAHSRRAESPTSEQPGAKRSDTPGYVASRRVRPVGAKVSYPIAVQWIGNHTPHVSILLRLQRVRTRPTVSELGTRLLGRSGS